VCIIQVSIIAAFKKTSLSVIQNFPALHIEFYYVTRGDGSQLNAAGIASRDRVLDAVRTIAETAIRGIVLFLTPLIPLSYLNMSARDGLDRDA
jgi:hypothetical protein